MLNVYIYFSILSLSWLCKRIKVGLCWTHLIKHDKIDLKEKQVALACTLKNCHSQHEAFLVYPYWFKCKVFLLYMISVWSIISYKYFLQFFLYVYGHARLLEPISEPFTCHNISVSMITFGQRVVYLIFM